jgi:hypothetical protein
MAGLRGEPVNGQARWLVGVALIISLMAAVWLSKAWSGGVVLYSAYGAVIGAPLLTADVKSFQRATRLGAVALVLVGLIGIFWGLPSFWPAVPLLLLASHVAHGQARIYRAFVAGGTLIGVIAVAGWSFAIYETALRPPDAFLVVYDSTSAAAASGFSERDTDTIGLGATKISKSGRIWRVYFNAGIPSAERTRLQQRVLDVSGASRVRLCSRWGGEC